MPNKRNQHRRFYAVLFCAKGLAQKAVLNGERKLRKLMIDERAKTASNKALVGDFRCSAPQAPQLKLLYTKEK